ncbi:phosphoglycerate dehydrogenase [Pseudomonas sp. S 311-6]|jgi:D-3-phosphoglycerate dehydrogenase|uniref:D-3-phosphoglycerate dehydrogenase n=1 Tax=Kerstersia gyiorum TaxID=206506 RepID=A0A171KWI9_9BURK|nr:phosphoglycerate dehydrogenase [Kerstersia gyiorum]AZV94920.1 D-3-phosphoglycerate dehydrogenase [Bordetella sp. J329]MCO7635808.1 phosphoglycerate dehydrogenase [Pseudomonas sp. S 311-6]KAB0544944.1 phosphoglycerate dehydrogenase [Kerstersia gyiorum]KKO73256.1 D-3-phosphoglycerate dehydrogenase [Kerstersia gyiorum]MCH4270630.1 phosphoglycerate dehydrogenase [Kerstersia gyiorum]
MANIVLFENIHPSAREVFKQAGLTNIVSHAIALPPDELRAALKTADIVGIRSRTNLDAGLLNEFPNIRVIGCFCIGTNQVALDVAAQRGIPVFNAPFSNTRSVAELVLAEAILLLRRIPEKNDRVHGGHWDKTATGAFEARGKTLGIVGYGNIGSQVSTLAEGLGMRVIYHDIEAKLPLGNARAALSLDQLLEESDVVTLHVPGGSGTANIINAERLARTKKGAIIINASRGTVVDIQALRDAIVSGHIAGAALDVFPTEPKGPNEPLQSPLVGLPNVILTPHIGGSTQESQENIGREVAEKLVRYWLSGTTKGAVNFPELPYLEANGETRVLHIHRNAPGAVSALNNTLAEKGLNIVSQTLQTKGQLGYVVTDVDGPVGDDVLELLRSHPATIRVERVSVN